ncbi:MAG: ABC transporter ATP-binding protein [Gemmatimonadaceae bacterium]|nr:ABC transporter ATP-binding protein [Acetobacteraceae bacterium]
MTEARLTLEGVSVSRGGRRVLHDVSLNVGSGEVVALLGANGAGKSSLVMTCVGVHAPDSGSIHLDGVRLDGLSPDRIRRHGVAVVAEGHRVLGKLTVRENLDVSALQHPAHAVRSVVEHTLELFPELVPHLGATAGNLSGGQKQMVAICQALIAQPRILLIDELSLGLAPVVVNRLVAALKTIAAQGVGILLVEQFTTLALSMADRAYLLELGRLAYEGPASVLSQNPEILHRAYLASAAGAS